MNFATEVGCKEFPMPKVVRAVVCCDLDETYIPFSKDNKVNGGVSELESFMRDRCEALGVVLGWVTGTNLPSALRKAKGYISASPHFICCSLGTEFYWVKDGRARPSGSWQQSIAASGFEASNVEQLLAEIEAKDIALTRQHSDYQGRFKFSYYYFDNPERERHFTQIARMAESRQVRVLFAKCSPAAGDPAGSYDVEFIPPCCGKDKAVAFLQARFGLRREGLYGFGDGFNDFPMFDAVGNGFLVGNALPAVIEQRGSALARPYCHGILDVLRALENARHA